MKFLSIIGCRPQYIKVLDNLENHVIVDTGQHYDKEMSDTFIKQLKIKVKHYLNAETLGDIYEKSCQIIALEKPDIVIVYGDTRSTLGGALAAKFQAKTLAHVESGLRSGDIKQPEEIIRILVDRIADYKFCPNQYARENLRKEGLYNDSFVVGDPMWDNLNKVLPIKKTKDCGKYNLLTLHRQSITEDNLALENIFRALRDSGEKFIFPCHPRTRKALSDFKIKVPENVELIKPQGYKEMISLETNAKKILTDSGGVQREAYWFNKPVIILRWVTEWNEIIEDDWGVLVGSNYNMILNAIEGFNPAHPPKYIPDFGAKIKIKELLYG